MSDEQHERPATDDRNAWKAYWTAVGIPWRIEPEIDESRRTFLAERRAVKPDIERGISPFKDIKLTRADVEWLLATHESGGMKGPVDWSDEKQRARQGLDLRGADLQGIDLRSAPLARLRAGLTKDEWIEAPTKERDEAAVTLTGATLVATHLEGAFLSNAQLRLADLRDAHLECSDLYQAHLEGARLSRTRLHGASLRVAFFDATTNLQDVELGTPQLGFALLAGTHWGGADLSAVNWAAVQMLGDEEEALQGRYTSRNAESRRKGIIAWDTAVRSNRQLAVALRDQGLNEHADRFAYRAQVLQRHVLLRQGHLLRCLGSLFLDFISGYGYRPLRSFLTYIVVVLGFAAAYFLLMPITGVHFEALGALVFSVTSFHGRGFSPGESVALTNPVTVLAAGEAIIGLLIEITFIATFTQRFFAR
jgi:hypothetical protein